MSSVDQIPSKAEIKNAIPVECFKRSVLHSFFWILVDTIQALICVFVASICLSTEVPRSGALCVCVWLLGWNIYAFCMGTVLTGHWVIAHECGHGAFSDNSVLNDIVGFILHQSLMVPYFSWQYTHAKHHRRTNNLVDGESHVPSTTAENGLFILLHSLMGDEAFAGFQVIAHLFLGWPLYLLGLASTGRLGADGKPLNGDVADHFRPHSRMFPVKLRPKIWVSTLTLLTTFFSLVVLCWLHGPLVVLLWYGGPYLWVNAWLVLYTWLQHTDPSVPHFGQDEWTWVKGALCTIDRPYGIFDHFHHHIGSTHVVHHLFHDIPFYNATKATRALKAFLGPLYKYDETPWFVALWKVGKTCHCVDRTDGVQFFKSLGEVDKKKIG